jgi:ubiquinone/menaquinone biosynthesis C-methylase UbiE
MAKRVAPGGRVYATDIQPGMIELLQRRVKAEGLDNVTTILGAMDDPALPPRSIDLAIMVDVYHELQQPQVFLQRLRDTFKPGGRLVLLEFRKDDPKVPILEVHKMSVAEVKAEMEAEGSRSKVIDVPWHIIVFGSNKVKSKRVQKSASFRMLKGATQEAAANSSAPSS